jgi:shikimate kinase
LHIALIGMSNVGKSHWAKRLMTEANFSLIECDALIGQRLRPHLDKNLPVADALPRWMGMPYEARYAENSRTYLMHEKAVMQDSLQKLKDQSAPPFVLDTTGSVIYTGDDTLKALSSGARIIYLETTPAQAAQFFADYIRIPKPTIFGDIYAPRPGEDPQDTLRRCYPELLKYRAARYKNIAHVTIPYEVHRNPGTGVNSFLAQASITR